MMPSVCGMWKTRTPRRCVAGAGHERKRWRHIAFNGRDNVGWRQCQRQCLFVRFGRLVKAPPRELVGHNSTVYGVAFSPDSQLMATIGFADDTVRLWDIRSLQEARLIKTLRGGHTDSVTGIAFAPMAAHWHRAATTRPSFSLGCR